MIKAHWPIHSRLDPFVRLLHLVPGARRIIDGGANKGRTVERFLDLYPEAHVAAYEPMPRLARKLHKRFADDRRVSVRAAALGSCQDRLCLNVLESATCSSFLAPTGIRDKHAGKPMDVAQTVLVDVVCLDCELAVSPDIIKLDLQGYELEALRGAEAVLRGVTAVLCEVAFADLYEGQPNGGEVIAWMEERGFRLDGLYGPWFDRSGAVIAADALFVAGREE